MKFLRLHTTTQVGEDTQPQTVKPSTTLNLLGFFNIILSYGPIVLAFLIPVFFLSLTSEYYEFNKQMLLVLGTVILVVAWFGKMWMQKELRIVRTPLDLPILVFVIVYLAGTFTSLNVLVSVFGHFGRFNEGVVSVLCYALLYFVFVNNVKTLSQVKRIGLAMSLSGIILAVYGILQYFQIYLIPVDFAKNRFFTPTGSPDVLSYYAMAVLPITLSILALSKNVLERYALAIGSVALFVLIALVNILVALGLAILGVAVFFYFSREVTFNRNRTLFTTLVVAYLVIASLAVPGIRNIIPQDLRDLPKEINLDWNNSWQVAASTISKSPLLGSGPDTFLFDFTKYRDVTMNSTPYWNLRFDRANSELLQILATLGLVGLAAFLFLIYRVARLGAEYLLREKELEVHTLSVGFAAATLSLLVFALLFGHFSTVTAFTLWISLALLVRLWVEEKQVIIKSTVISIPFRSEGGAGGRDVLPFATFLVVTIVGVLVLSLFGHIFVAETDFQSSLVAAKANDGKKTYDLQVAAIQTDIIGISGWQIHVDRDIYHSVFSGTNLLLANSLSSQTKPDTNTLQGLVSQAVSEATTAKNINPNNVNNWQQMATVYRSLINVVTGSDQFAENSYVQAVTLDPTNASLRDGLGTFYTQDKRHDDAINTLVLATRLKPDLAVAHFDLARALVARAAVDGTTKDGQRNYLTAAQNEYQTTQKLVTAGSSDEKQVIQELNDVTTKLTALGGPATSTTTPTVPPTATPSGTKR